MTSSHPLQVVDFHCHFLGAAFKPTTLEQVPAEQQDRWQHINQALTNPALLIETMERSGVSTRVISTPLEFLQIQHGDVDASLIPRINDNLAATVARYPHHLQALATVDVFGGEAAAQELTRAVKDLGMRGVFMACAKGGLLPDDARARPALAAAAEMGVPVFMHPVPDTEFRTRFKACGRLSEPLSRSTINSAALLAMLEGGVFEELPTLHVVVTALALGGLCLAKSLGVGAHIGADEPAAARRHVYADTTGLSPFITRTAVELLGADHVLMGSDWPVVDDPHMAARVADLLAACKLAPEDQQRIAGGNARRLLKIQEVSAAAMH